MSADEIRRLADSNAIHRPKCRTSEKFPRCREWCPTDEAKKCKDADNIRSALLDYAAMVERCEATIRILDNGCHKNDVGILKYILKGATDGTH